LGGGCCIADSPIKHCTKKTEGGEREKEGTGEKFSFFTTTTQKKKKKLQS
jgi:hypothetical protein